MRTRLTKLALLIGLSAVAATVIATQTCCTDQRADIITDAGAHDAGQLRVATSWGHYSPRRCLLIEGQSNGAGRKFIEQVSQPQHDILVGSYANVPLSEWESGFTTPFTVLYDTETQTGSQSPVRATGPLAPRPYTLVPNAIPNMGIELSLGHGLDPYALNQWGVIKCNIGGTSLATEWKPTGTYPAVGSGNLFNTCITQVNKALRTIGCQPAAVLWIQGESDACNATLANAYQANLVALVAAYRAQWPRIPFILNRLSANYTGCGDASTLATIRAAQVALVAATPRSAWVDSDNILLDSGIHFVPDGYVTLGYRFVPAVLNAMGFALPPAAAFSFSAQTRTANFLDLSTDPNVGAQANPAIGGSITSWSWDFGDSATSTQQNPSHTYAADGAYTVTLTVGNGTGVKGRTSLAITVATPTWTTDATSGVGWPSTGAEWTDFETKHLLTAYGVPSNLYLYQQASGTIGDVTGAKTLNITNTPTYQKSITGWSRKAVGGSGATQSQNSNNTTYTNLTATSWLAVGYIRHDPSTGGNRPILSLGGSGVVELETAGSTQQIRLRVGATGSNGTQAHSGTAPHPYALLYDKTNSRACVFSDLEKMCGTFASSSGAAMTATFSTTADGTIADFLALARWEGAAAERSDAEIKHLLNALGWAPKGY